MKKIAHKLSKFFMTKTGIFIAAVICAGIIISVPLLKFTTFFAKMEGEPVITDYQLPVLGSDPNSLTAGPDGNLWFSAAIYGGGGEIGKITTSGLIEQQNVFNGQSGPIDIAAGPDGNIWFTEYYGQKIGFVNSNFALTEFTIPEGGSPVGITAGPDGNLWYTDDTGKIGKITPQGNFTVYPLMEGVQPQFITAGPDGNLWFTQLQGNIGRITTGGQVTDFPAPAYTGGITAGADGNLWFTETQNGNAAKISTTGVVTRYPAPASCESAGCIARDITAGPDGNLWFTTYSRNNTLPGHIVRITPEGVMTEYEATRLKPAGISSGPDGNIWFTYEGGSAIGRVSLSPISPSDTPAPTIEPTNTPLPSITVTPTPTSTPTPIPSPTSTPTPIPTIACTTSSAGFNSCDPDLQKGDIIFSRTIDAGSIGEAALFGGYWSHVGIYNGDGTITESYPEPLFNGINPNDSPGVISSLITSQKSLLWRNNVNDWAIVRVNNLTSNQNINAVNYALGKANRNIPYNYTFWDKEAQDKFYCSQLIWRSYYNEGFDLDSNLSGFSSFVKIWNTPLSIASDEFVKNTVPPDDIYFSPKVSIIKERSDNQSNATRWVFRILSPAKLLVTDSQGRRTGYDPASNASYQEIPGTYYGGKDAEPQFMTYRGSFEGIWKFQMKGTGTGSYSFLTESINKDTHQTQPVTGNIQSGQTVTYEITNPSSSGQPLQIQRQAGIKLVPQSIYPLSGLAAVSILGESNFDVNNIDIASLRLGVNGAKPILNKGFIVDVNKDLKKDLITVYFNKQTGVKSGDKELCITGKTKTGQQFKGCSAIKTLSKPPAIKIAVKLLGITDSKLAALVQAFLNSIKQ